MIFLSIVAVLQSVLWRREKLLLVRLVLRDHPGSREAPGLQVNLPSFNCLILFIVHSSILTA